MKELSLSEIQNCQLKILQRVKTLCESNNISYYVISGTLLGTVRHNGFIPWDDDTDIIIPRPDYNKFLKLWKDNDKFVLYFPDKQKDYYFSFAKVVYTDTVLKREYLKDISGYGVSLDIFPLDSVGSKSILDLVKYNLCLFFRKLHALSNYKIFPNYKTGIEKYLGRLVFNVCEKIGFKKFRNLENLFIDYYNYDNSMYVGNYFGDYGIKEIYLKKYFLDSVCMKFENIEVNVPVGYKEILRQLYGNYMELPPIENRVSNHQHNKIYWKE